MEKQKLSPRTVTEAQLQSHYTVMFIGGEANRSSNARTVPYVDLYRGRTGPMETPAEHLQQAAKDEQTRKPARKPAF